MPSNPAQKGGNREDNERWMRERQAQKREDAHLGKLARVRHPYRGQKPAPRRVQAQNVLFGGLT